MKKLLLVLLFVPLINCSKGNGSFAAEGVFARFWVAKTSFHSIHLGNSDDKAFYSGGGVFDGTASIRLIKN